MAKKLTILDFFKKYPTEDICLDHVMETRYGTVSKCPKCGKDTTFYRIKKRPAYACEFCGHHIYPCAGTPFENTRTPLQMWFYAIYLFTTTKHGVPAKELQRQLGVTYKTAWRMGHEIRKYMAKVDGDDGLSGHVEMDETYMGGKVKYFAKGEFPRGLKTVVFGIVERGGKVVTHVVDKATGELIYPLIGKYVPHGSRVSTDQAPLTRGSGSAATATSPSTTLGKNGSVATRTRTPLIASGRTSSAASRALTARSPRSTCRSISASSSSGSIFATFLRSRC